MIKKFLLLILPVLLLTGCTIPFLGKKNSGIRVLSTPTATVTLDGKQIGQTPLEKDKLKPGKHQLRLVPESGSPWESDITLNNQLQTVIDRNFGPTDQESEGYSMILEKTNDEQKSQLTVSTIPDRAIIRLDGQPKGFAPVSTVISSESNHEVSVSSAGYQEKKIPILVPKGHRLILTVQLARAPLLPSPPESSESAQPEENLTPTPTPQKSSAKITPGPTPTTNPKITPTPSAAPARPYVEILKTGTVATQEAPKNDWLRVREQSNQSSEIISYVYAGETHKFIDSSETGWYQIELPDGKTGWISGQYAKLYR